MSALRQLREPIVENGIKNTNFFNGRLLSAEDLQVEQQARRRYDAIMGQAVGPGVLQGLEVSLDGSSAGDGIVDLIRIRAGTCVNAEGLALDLPRAVQVGIRQQPVSTEAGADFIPCTMQQFVPTNTGFYLFLLSPASSYRGSAPYSGLGQGGRISGCGKRYKMEGVQLRMVKAALDTALGVSPADAAAVKKLVDVTNLTPDQSMPLPKLSLLRSRAAALFLGVSTAEEFASDPYRRETVNESLQSACECYGLAERMVAAPAKSVTAEDVPLALVYWTNRGACFVDNWAVRRRTVQPFRREHWGYAFGGRRQCEGEAMVLQFQAQLDDLLKGENGFSSKVLPASLTAQDYFAWLPPAGLLKVAEAVDDEGIQLGTFFKNMKVRELKKKEDPLYIEGAGLDGLLREALAYPPMGAEIMDPDCGDPEQKEMVWVYHVRENERVAKADRYLAFANGHIPYRGEARFDVNYWDYANYA
jgi:hypothetical protein